MRRLLALLVAAPLAACSSAPRRPDRVTQGDYGYARAHLAWLVRDAMAKHGVKGVSLALVDDQQVVMAEGFGLADEARGVPATAETLYRIGSLSKLFTALEVVRLADGGRIDLDRDVTAYVPRFSMRSRFAATQPVTVRALLAHHAGLPSDLLRGMWVARPGSLEDLVEELREESLASPPQTLFKYSNIGYSLLGRAVELALARPLPDAMRAEILAPIGMSRSSFAEMPELAAETSKGYRSGAAIPALGLRDAPAGSMVSCASDMARFLRFVFAGGRVRGDRLVSEAALDAMFQPQFAGLPLDLGHEVGLGFQLSGLSPSGRRAAWHTGAYPPFFAVLALLRDEKLGVVLLANGEEARSFALEVATKALELALEVKRGSAAPPTAAARRPRFHPAPGAVGRRAGRYVVLGELTEIQDAGDRLRASFGGAQLDLVPVASDRFVPEKRLLFGLLRYPLAPLEIQFAEVEGRALAVMRGTPAPLAFERVAPVALPASWLARLGRYAPEDLSGEAFTIRNLRLEDQAGVLVARVALSGLLPGDAAIERRLALRPVSDDEAVVAGIANGEGGTVRAMREGGREVLRYSGFRFSAAVEAGR